MTDIQFFKLLDESLAEDNADGIFMKKYTKVIYEREIRFGNKNSSFAKELLKRI